jgi:Mrp family chromosome partitioning ATPase
LVDSVLLVVQERRTTSRQLSRALEILAQAGRSPVGLVLNRVGRRGDVYGYGYGYGYSYGYGPRHEERGRPGPNGDDPARVPPVVTQSRE